MMVNLFNSENFAPEIIIDRLEFKGVDPHWAKRSASVLESALEQAIEAQPYFKQKVITTPLSLNLNEVDFSSPERLGKALARVIIGHINS